MIISMEAYRQKKVTANSQAALTRYDEELLCVNWNPAVGALALSSYQRLQELSPPLPRENEKLDPGFMQRVYALATQI